MSTEAMKLALEALDNLMYWDNSKPEFDDARKAIKALEKALAQEQGESALLQPVATVIEELEHDGQGFCAKVRWLCNPVPVGETLSWEQPK